MISKYDHPYIKLDIRPDVLVVTFSVHKPSLFERIFKRHSFKKATLTIAAGERRLFLLQDRVFLSYRSLSSLKYLEEMEEMEKELFSYRLVKRKPIPGTNLYGYSSNFIQTKFYSTKGKIK